jgi:hypothetical protein
MKKLSTEKITSFRLTEFDLRRGVEKILREEYPEIPKGGHMEMSEVKGNPREFIVKFISRAEAPAS